MEIDFKVKRERGDQMKSLFKLGVILIGILIFTYAEVWGADWIFVGDYNNHHLYYDTQSISRSS